VIRDPIFGGWDWDGIRQLAFMIATTGLLVSFAASTAGNWYDPWAWILESALIHSTPVLLISMIVLMVLYWHWRFEGGV